jgi:hypothetical protein
VVSAHGKNAERRRNSTLDQHCLLAESFGMNKKIRGSCLCGAVRFEVEPPFIRAGHCHCERCRKHSGTAMCTQARVPKEQFRLLQGERLIRVYGKGEGAVKAFCVNCGSSLFGGDWPEGDEVSIRMGAFDGDPGICPQYHTFVNDRAAWDEIADNLPQYPFALSDYARPISARVESE